MSLIEQAWQKGSFWLWLLWPLSLIFRVLSALRRTCFKLGIFTSERLAVPVIIVGNISVGGNGKTPVVLAIAEHLKAQGYQPGVLSRGYGGTCPVFPHMVTSQCAASYVGDEPALIYKRLGIPVVIDPDRVRGGRLLEQSCDVIICDDGLQHYRLRRDIEIVVMDERRHGNGCLLPMGPLREGQWRLSTVDFLIINNATVIAENEIKMELSAGSLKPVLDNNDTPVPAFFSQAVAAIGNPQRFFQYLQDHQFIIHATQAFPDHHRYTPDDLDTEGSIIMTEKDAVKCKDFAAKQWFYLPVSAYFSQDFLLRLQNKIETTTAKKNNK